MRLVDRRPRTTDDIDYDTDLVNVDIDDTF